MRSTKTLYAQIFYDPYYFLLTTIANFEINCRYCAKKVSKFLSYPVRVNRHYRSFAHERSTFQHFTHRLISESFRSEDYIPRIRSEQLRSANFANYLRLSIFFAGELNLKLQHGHKRWYHGLIRLYFLHGKKGESAR